MMWSPIIPLLLTGAAAAAPQWPFGSPSAPESNSPKVNVTLYVMSRCPDARLCENVFEEVIGTKGIANKINLDVGYIGAVNTSEPLGVTCKHGELECIGNAHQLCLLHHLSLDTFYANIACQNYQDFPGKIGTLGLTKQCALASKVDWDASGVGACIEGKGNRVQVDGGVDALNALEGDADGAGALGKQAQELLRKSVKRTAKRGISTSCTIVIDSTIVKGGERRCVVDGGVWKGCDDGHTAADFVRVIEAEYKHL